MTITIHLDEEIEKQIRFEADLRQQSLDFFVADLIRRNIASPSHSTDMVETATTKNWLDAFRQYLGTHAKAQPPLPDEAFQREHFYAERDQ